MRSYICQATATIICRESAVICGRPWVDAVFAKIDPAVRIEWLVTEGERVKPDQVLYRLHGSARSLLTGERTALNFLQTLSGTATAVRQYVDAVAGTLIHASVFELVVKREDDRAGEVRVHFPRAGFRVTPAA